MKGERLPDEDNVIRHVGSSKLREDGTPSGSAFILSAKESGLSVNWIECFSGLDKAAALDKIRCQMHRHRGRRSIFAELNIGEVTRVLASQDHDVRFIHDPLPADDKYDKEDASHSQIVGLPAWESPKAAEIADMIADLVSGCHPAVVGYG